MFTAIVTGITGQDGSYLAELLLRKNYRVIGITRDSGPGNCWRLAALGCLDKVELLTLSLADPMAVQQLLLARQPDEIYHLAGQTSVIESVRSPMPNTQQDIAAILNLLEAIRTVSKGSRLFNASSSEVFGRALSETQNESTPLNPTSPYACVKTFGQNVTAVYRERYDLHASSGILFNHESPLRGPGFVSQKIVDGLVRRVNSSMEPLALGNLDSHRDWGYAPEYVEAMWRMLQCNRGGDYVLATGVSHSVKEFATAAAQKCGFELTWESSDGRQIATDKLSGRRLIEVDPGLQRPGETARVRGDSSKARTEFQWTPHTGLDKLVEILVEAKFACTTGGKKSE